MLPEDVYKTETNILLGGGDRLYCQLFKEGVHLWVQCIACEASGEHEECFFRTSKADTNRGVQRASTEYNKCDVIAHSCPLTSSPETSSYG